MTRKLSVVGAIIRRDGLLLCAKRGPDRDQPGLWEFPGGKVEAGESPSAALTREIAEELGCDIRVGAEVATTTHEYDTSVITLTTFWCELVAGEPAASEHAELRWMAPHDLLSLEWAPADLPAVHLAIAPVQFWEGRYSESTRVWSGAPNRVLVDVVTQLEAAVQPGRALDLGCGEGADVIWLARGGGRRQASTYRRLQSHARAPRHPGWGSHPRRRRSKLPTCRCGEAPSATTW